MTCRIRSTTPSAPIESFTVRLSVAPSLLRTQPTNGVADLCGTTEGDTVALHSQIGWGLRCAEPAGHQYQQPASSDFSDLSP